MTALRRFEPALAAAVGASVLMVGLAAPSAASDSKRFPECSINSEKTQTRLARHHSEWNSYFNQKGWDVSCRYLQWTFYEVSPDYGRLKQQGNPIAAKRKVMKTGRWHFLGVAGYTDGYGPKWVGYQYWKAFRYWLHLPLD